MVSKERFFQLKRFAEDGVYRLFSLGKYSDLPAFMQVDARKQWFNPEAFLKLPSDEQKVFRACTQYCANVPEGTCYLALHYQNLSIENYAREEIKRLEPLIAEKRKSAALYTELQNTVNFEQQEQIGYEINITTIGKSRRSYGIIVSNIIEEK